MEEIIGDEYLTAGIPDELKGLRSCLRCSLVKTHLQVFASYIVDSYYYYYSISYYFCLLMIKLLLLLL